MADILIVHLSDLHLGPNPFWRHPLQRTQDPDLIKGLEDALRKVCPDFVVISGDIVNNPAKSNVSRAADTLRTVFTNAGIDIREKVLVVPGNHDVPIRNYRHEYFGRVLAFIEFLKQLFAEADYVSRKTRFVRVDLERKICFVGVDSTLKDKVQLAEGEVGPSQRAWLQRKLEQLGKSHEGFEHFVKIVVLHHHPESIAARASDNRFMQLLDEADVKQVFEKVGVNLVLHGHKHFPHRKKVSCANGRHYTVIGAGTTLCPIPQEQAGSGNGFNLIRIRPPANMVEVQEYRASGDKKFLPFGSPERGRLFHGADVGYRIRTCELNTRILDLDGRCIDTNRRIGVFVDAPRDDLPQTSFRWGTESVIGEIVDFEYDVESIAGINYDISEDLRNSRRRKGTFVLHKPLLWGGPPVDLWWTFEAKAAFCMRRTDYQRYYPGQNAHDEGVAAKVVHPTDTLILSVEFPRKFWVPVTARCFDENQIPADLGDHVVQSDRIAGRHTLVVRKPKLGFEYSLLWNVP